MEEAEEAAPGSSSLPVYEENKKSNLDAGEIVAETNTGRNEVKDGATGDDIADVCNERNKKTRALFEAVNDKVSEAYNLWTQDFELLESARKSFSEMTKKLKDVHFQDIIKLNVGGQLFQTSLQTLRRYPNSFFDNMFSESHDLREEKEGAFFIDRDGSHFRSVLNYMRTGKVPSRMKEKHEEELIEEAEFYGLQSLSRLLKVSDDSEEDTEDSETAYSETESDNEQLTIAENAKHSRAILDEVKQQLKTGQAALQDDIKFLEGRKETFLNMVKKMDIAHFPKVVKLNVGGQLFETSVATLQKDAGSMFAAMFSQRFELSKQSDNTFFIDRDGTHFRHILNYLRIGKVPRSIIDDIGEELLEEAEFYNLKGLIDTLPKDITVQLNVRGEVFVATMEALKRHKDSIFAEMLTKNGTSVPRVDGAYHFDRDNSTFRLIVKYTEDEKLARDDVYKHRKELYEESEYYRLNNLKKYVLKFGNNESEILPAYKEHWGTISNWISEDDNSILWLLYSGKRDGWSSSKFHSLCDGMGPTLVLMESRNGCVFGGYTNLSWGGSGGEDSAGFLFSLASHKLGKQMKFPLTKYGGTYCDASKGPSFYDPHNNIFLLEVPDMPNRNKCHYNHRKECCDFPASVPNSDTFLAGTRSFYLYNLEVFQVDLI